MQALPVGLLPKQPQCWELQRVSSEFVPSRRSSGDGPFEGGGRAKGCRGFKTFPRLKDAVVESAFREGVFDRATQAEDAAAAVGRDFECFAFPEVFRWRRWACELIAAKCSISIYIYIISLMK